MAFVPNIVRMMSPVQSLLLHSFFTLELPLEFELLTPLSFQALGGIILGLKILVFWKYHLFSQKLLPWSPISMGQNVIHCRFRFSIYEDTLLLQLFFQIFKICQLYVRTVWRGLGWGWRSIFTSWLQRHHCRWYWWNSGWWTSRIFSLSFFQHV